MSICFGYDMSLAVRTRADPKTNEQPHALLSNTRIDMFIADGSSHLSKYHKNVLANYHTSVENLSIEVFKSCIHDHFVFVEI